MTGLRQWIIIDKMLPQSRDLKNDAARPKIHTDSGCNAPVVRVVKDMHGLVYKLVLIQGVGRVVSRQADVQLTMTMYVTRKDACYIEQIFESFYDNQLPSDFIKIYEHTECNPYVKSVTNIMPVGLQKAVLTMCRDEEAIVYIDPLMAYGCAGLNYGDKAKEQIQPSTALVYKIRLIRWKINNNAEQLEQFSSLQSATPTFVELLAQARKQLLAGKKFTAMQSLRRGITVLETIPIDQRILEPMQKQEHERTLLYILKLASQTAMQLGWYNFTVSSTRRALQIDPKNTEIIFLQGCAYFALGYSDIARQKVRQAHLRDVTNRDYREKLDEINRHVTLIDDSESDDECHQDYEQMASIIMERKAANAGRIVEDVMKLCKELADSGEPDVLIRGGFSFEDVKSILNALQSEMDSEIVVKLFRENIEVEFLCN